MPTGWPISKAVHTAQQRATLAVNRELVLLYWHIGRDILARQAEQGWEAKVIERLAHDLRAVFPDMRGFRRAISNTCARLPRHGRMRNLCKRCLHNCHGVTIWSC